MTRFGIIVVTWNSAEVIGRCLDSCLGPEGAGPERTVVVDNASSDDTVAVARAKGVRVIANEQNQGFAAGVNLGAKALADCEAVLLLNPDAVLLGGVSELADAVSGPHVGAAAGRLLDEDGSDQDGFNVRSFPNPVVLALEVLGLNRVWSSNPWNRGYRREIRSDGAVEIDQPAAAFLMVNRLAWERIGGFDEGFRPVWFEDVDFCLRLNRAGYRILFIPGASAGHIGGHSATLLLWGDRQLFWYRSLLRYCARHFRRSGQLLVSTALMLASVLRAGAGLLSGRGLNAIVVFGRIFRLAFALAIAPKGADFIADAGGPSREEKRARQFPA